MARVTLERLEKTDVTQYPSNSLIDYYDTIHKLLEAITLKDGFKIKGEGSHKELINFVARKHNMNKSYMVFLQQMRDYRNRISYEGFMVHKNYIILHKEKINRIIQNLIDLLNRSTEI